MKKNIMAIFSVVVILSGIGGTVWGLSAAWHGYKAEETIHETAQDERITIAMNQSNLARWQQRANWLEERIWEIEREHKCPQCSGVIKRTYEKYLKEYELLQQKIAKLLES